MKPFSKISNKISKGHSDYNVCSAYTYRPRISPKSRSSEIFLCILDLTAFAEK